MAGEDIVYSYHNGTSCYISKPIGFEGFKKAMDTTNNFWFSVVKFPEKS